MLKDKTIVLGVTGSIAAYKAAMLASFLVKNHADVRVIMTENATNIINPIAFETLTGHKCLVDTFDRNFEFSVNHISLAKQADCFIVAPATANFIAKAACGIADDMLTTTYLAAKCPKIVSPAMNTAMFEADATQENLSTLRRRGVAIVEPESGHLACGDEGKGKFPETDVLFEYILKAIAKKDLDGKKILVTAGATREKLDPVRFLTNHSTGKMGFEIARAASIRGAEVTLVAGAVSDSLRMPIFAKVLKIESAADMFSAVKDNFESQDFVIKAAAVADFTPENVKDEKIKKDSLNSGGSTPLLRQGSAQAGSETDGSTPSTGSGAGGLELKLKSTTDILKYLGENKKPNQKIIGFSMETENVIENSKAKLKKKNADMICANSLKTEGAGFGGETNVVTMIKNNGEIELPLMSKFDVANRILDEILKL